jgi:hypothetical protein
MRRVHTTFDLLEAHILTGMLREHGVAVWLFDADFVRQDWFKSIAYGGYRILVRDEDVAEARTLLNQYDDEELALIGEHALCPHCGRAAGRDDPQPRRNVFLAMIMLPIMEYLVFLRWKLSPIGMLVVFAVQFFLYATLPWLVMGYFKWRLRCADCGFRWRQPPMHRHAELVRLAQAGESTLQSTSPT